jgi:hypothetical protein
MHGPVKRGEDVVRVAASSLEGVGKSWLATLQDVMPDIRTELIDILNDVIGLLDSAQEV